MASALHGSLDARLTMWDAVVVGAGPAGSIAARQLAREGASVLLLERQRFPRWKVCGACLGPAAVQLLDSVGLGSLPARHGASLLDRVVLMAGGRRSRVALRGTLALSRTVLDRALADAAIEEGVDFRDGVRVSLGAPIQGGVELELRTKGDAVTEQTRVVIDATGLGAGLARRQSAGAAHQSRGVVAPRSRIGVGATLEASEYDIPAEELRMVVGRRGYVGLVRVEGGLLHVAAAIDPDALCDASPEEVVQGILAESGSQPLPGALVHRWKGTPLLTRRPREVASHRVLRIGDAAGYVEPFTGEGMSLAIASGVAVAPFAAQASRGWTDGLAANWISEHRRRIGRSQRLCRVLARALRNPRVVRTAVRILGTVPSLADPLVRSLARAPAVEMRGHNRVGPRESWA